MRIIKFLSASLIAGFLCAGCALHTQPVAPEHRSLSANEVFFQRLKQAPGVDFLSHNGTWVGNDSDYRVRLLRDSRVEVTQYGIGIDHFGGTYRVNHDGRIFLRFDDPKRQWAPLVLREKKGILMLYREDGRSAHPDVMGPGIPKNHEIPGYWPFRESRKGASP